MSEQQTNLLAQRLKQWRKKNQLTLQQLSQRCGISTATLSKIENGQLSPTYEKIAALAQGLAIDVGEFFRSETENPPLGRRSVTRRGMGVQHHTEQYIYELLNTDLANKRFIPMLATLKAHEKKDFPRLHQHDGEEFFYVLSGKVILLTELYTPLELNQGDSCYFDSQMKHACLSAQDEDAQILWISYTFPFADVNK
ncbi:MAG: XRE family transcriptional regulator [Neisseria sp.]|nr:XRE family transcriptional regulator [Neisseria sp.]